MTLDLPAADRARLRELASVQARYAALPVMEARRQQWYALNDNVPGARPPVILETWTFDRDFLPRDIFRCISPLGRELETQLLRNVRNYELIDDDKVMPEYVSMRWITDINELGVKIDREIVPDSEGVNTGFHYNYPITDLARDLELLKPAACSVDRAATLAKRDFLRDIFDGLLDVRIDSGIMGYTMLTHRVIELMGMEAFFMAMMDTPDLVHQLMAYLRDNCLRMMKWAEREQLLRANNGNQCSFGSSYNFTRAFKDVDNDTPVTLKDMWGASNSQETVGISSEMYHEFCFPYYRDVAEPLGLLYYGCCEPAHPFWEDITRYPHLKKVSMNRWCDEHFVAERLRGTGIVYSRKPDPNFLGVDVRLREEGWRSHIRATLEAAKECQLEIIIRDVYSVHGNLAKAKRAVEIAREEIAAARG